MQDNGTVDRLPNFAVTAREWAWQQDVTPPARKLVLLAICERLNHGTGVAWPGADDIATRCGLKRRQVHEHLTALLDAGVLLVVEHRHGKGRPYPVYTVPPLVRCSAQSPTPLVQPSAQSPQVSEPLSAPERTKLVRQSAQTFVRHSAQEPVTLNQQPEPVVGYPPTVGKAKGSGEGEKAPTPPKKKSPKQQRIADVCDAITALGGKAPHLAPRDAQAVCASDAPPAEIGEMWMAVVKGTFPLTDRDRAFYRGNLNLHFLINHLNDYRERPSTPVNGGLSPASLAKLRRHEEAEAQERNHRRDRPSTPSPL